MNDQIAFANCAALASPEIFADYVDKIYFYTNYNETLLQSCRSEICSALWGVGNADISGIGMILGYFCEFVLGLFFALCFATLRLVSPKFSTTFRPLLEKGCSVFFDSAVFFAISIQIACTIELIRRDFGISANELGGFTTQITWAIALLSMLPLLNTLDTMDSIDSAKSGYRFFLFCCCSVLFFYTFVSRMIGDFAPSQIGEEAAELGTTIVRNVDWDKLNILCLSGVDILSTGEQNVLSVFGAAGSLLVIMYGLVRLLWYIAIGLFPSYLKKTQPISTFVLRRNNFSVSLTFVWCFVISLLTIPQLWGVLRLRGIQRNLAGNTNNVYVDDGWSFGQILSVMIFAPVFTEMGFLFIRKGGKKG
ncbi:hypothetical protein HYFRA_00005819 [Hymenoscyphus fraxineus]|uniref:Uncharacterized protein n=1 Tax=Hymenoscyphus fraxineus TaxID=746836 RepID=A0A9N9PIB3_9HELO|nr:hypothetical protein HYFRA_00005819 [Hymenoscyphus fraxineus]